MTASATARLDLRLHVTGQEQLRTLHASLLGLSKTATGLRNVSAALERIGAASRGLNAAGLSAGLAGFNARMVAVTPSSAAAVRGIRSVNAEMARLEARERSRGRAMHQGILLPGMKGPASVRGLRGFEDERTRLQRLAEQRAITAQAKESLGGVAPGGFLAGHGYATRPRQMLGAVRDTTIAAMGVGYIASTLGRGMLGLITPIREFEHSMTAVRTKGGFTAEQTASIADRARALGRTTQFSARESAAGAVELAAAGMKAPDIAAQLGNVSKFALGSNLGTEAASTILVETATQFQRPMSSFAHISDVLIKSANMSTISVDDMRESLKYVGSSAATAGVSLEEVSATLAMLGNRGIKGSLAGTAYRQILVGLTTPARQAKKAMADLGLTTADLNEGLNDVPKFMLKLDKMITDKGMNKAQRLGIFKRLFGVESIDAVSGMMHGMTTRGADGRTVWEAFRDGTRDVEGETQRAADLFGNTLDGKIRKLSASVEDLRIVFGEKLAPMLSDTLLPALGRAAIGFSNFVGANGPALSTAAVAVPTLLGGALLSSTIGAGLTGLAGMSGMAFGAAAVAALTAAAPAIIGAGLIAAIAFDWGSIGAKIWESLHPGELYPTRGERGHNQGEGRGGSATLPGDPAIDVPLGMSPDDPYLKRRREQGLDNPLMDYKSTGDPLLDQYRKNERDKVMDDPVLRGMHERDPGKHPWTGLMRIEIVEGKARVLSVDVDGPGPQVDVGSTVAP